MTHDTTAPATVGELTLTQRIIRQRDLGLPMHLAVAGSGLTPRMGTDLVREASAEDFAAVDAWTAALPPDPRRVAPDTSWRPAR